MSAAFVQVKFPVRGEKGSSKSLPSSKMREEGKRLRCVSVESSIIARMSSHLSAHRSERQYENNVAPRKSIRR